VTTNPAREEVPVAHMMPLPVVEDAIRHGRPSDDGAVIIRIPVAAAGERLAQTLSDSG
jgi:LytS/YehU family sensor histidine kinase